MVLQFLNVIDENSAVCLRYGWEGSASPKMTKRCWKVQHALPELHVNQQRDRAGAHYLGSQELV
jgi:hypothetical protein